MVAASRDLADYLKKMPPPDEIRRRLSANYDEAKMLRRLLRISEQREKVKEAEGGS